jgi:hypothetical protein
MKTWFALFATSPSRCSTLLPRNCLFTDPSLGIGADQMTPHEPARRTGSIRGRRTRVTTTLSRRWAARRRWSSTRMGRRTTTRSETEHALRLTDGIEGMMILGRGRDCHRLYIGIVPKLAEDWKTFHILEHCNWVSGVLWRNVYERCNLRK